MPANNKAEIHSIQSQSVQQSARQLHKALHLNITSKCTLQGIFQYAFLGCVSKVSNMQLAWLADWLKKEN